MCYGFLGDPSSRLWIDGVPIACCGDLGHITLVLCGSLSLCDTKSGRVVEEMSPEASDIVVSGKWMIFFMHSTFKTYPF